MKRLATIVLTLMASSPAFAGSGGFTYEPIPCPWSPSEAQCTSPTWANTYCGQFSLSTGLCAPVCDALTVTDAMCSDGDFLASVCGKAELEDWEQAISQKNIGLSDCAAHRVWFDRAGNMQWSTAPAAAPEPVLEPEDVCTGGGCVSQAGNIVTSATKVGAAPSLSYSGGYTSMKGFRRRVKAAKSWAALAYAMMLSQWNENGNYVGSCEEYVYEKYYDYTRFEDQTLGTGSFRKYYDVAYGATPLRGGGVAPTPGAIGTKGVLGQPLASKDGTALVRQPNIAKHRRKNTFYTLPPDDATPGMPRGPEWPEEILPFINEGAIKGCGGSLNRLVVCDPTLSAARYAGRDEKVIESWAFHQNMSATMAANGFIDEELYRADMLKDEFELHLQDRARAVKNVADYVKAHIEDELYPEEIEIPGSPSAPYEYVIDSVLQTSQILMSPYGATTALVPPLTQIHLADIALAAEVTDVSDISAIDSSLMPVIAANDALRSYDASLFGTMTPYSSTPTSSPTPIDPTSIPIFTDILWVPVTEDDLAPQHKFWLLMARVAEADYVLEQDLMKAAALGCLPADPTQPTPCDWSPRDFAQKVTDLYETEREADYARCQDMTASIGFGQINGRRLSLTKEVEGGGGAVEYVYPQISASDPDGFGYTTYTCALDTWGNLYKDAVYGSYDGLPSEPPPPFDPNDPNPPSDPTDCFNCNQWAQSSTHLDTYFVCLQRYKKLVLETLQDLGPLQDENGNLQLASSASEYEQMGSDDWNMYYGYGMGWSLGGFDSWATGGNLSDPCALAPEAYAHFKTGATALGKSVDIVHASAHVNTGTSSSLSLPAGEVEPNAVDIEVLGIEVFHEDVQVGGTFNIVSGQETAFQDFVHVKVPFALGPIPMSLGGGVTGILGIAYDVDGEVSCDKKGVTGTFTPFASINGYATLAIDAVVAEAGVKISITIIGVELPFTVVAALEGTGYNTQFAVSTNLDLVLKTLGGYFAVYLRILWESWEWKLFSWDGLRWAKNLFHHKFTVPVVAIAEAVAGL